MIWECVPIYKPRVEVFPRPPSPVALTALFHFTTLPTTLSFPIVPQSSCIEGKCSIQCLQIKVYLRFLNHRVRKWKH